MDVICPDVSCSSRTVGFWRYLIPLENAYQKDRWIIHVMEWNINVGQRWRPDHVYIFDIPSAHVQVKLFHLLN